MTLESASLLLLACPGPKTTNELYSFVFDENYTYFSNKVGVLIHEEMPKIAYQISKAVSVMALGARKRDIFVVGHILKKMEVLEECICALVI